MIAVATQRWCDRRASYRPPDDERFEPRLYEVAPLDSTSAKAFVVQHHYSGTFPAARFRFGLHRGAQLVGVAVFSVPVRASVLTNVFPGDPQDSVELGRFVLLDGVRRNGESWFIARCFDALRRLGLRGVVSFSDPFPRVAIDGSVVMPGHVGTIYQASNGVFLGQRRADSLRLLPDGRAFPNRAAAKIRQREQGWRYAVEQLVAAGAPAPVGDLGTWLRLALAQVTRLVRHPGCLKYAWSFSRADRLPASLPYRKRDEVRS